MNQMARTQTSYLELYIYDLLYMMNGVKQNKTKKAKHALSLIIFLKTFG